MRVSRNGFREYVLIIYNTLAGFLLALNDESRIIAFIAYSGFVLQPEHHIGDVGIR